MRISGEQPSFSAFGVVHPRLLLFSKAPKLGLSKTRLVSRLRPALAEEVLVFLLRRAMTEAVKFDPEAELWLDGDPAQVSQDLWRGPIFRQGKGDLGERLGRAAAKTWAAGLSPIIIGSDCPTLDAACLAQTAQLLRTHDAVLGPATDGGYVLIALRLPVPEAFKDIPWSAPQTLAETREKLRQAGLCWAELEPLSDIDDISDLRSFLLSRAGREIMPPQLFAALLAELCPGQANLALALR